MGGKRPDQHNIDPGEAGSTDYRWRGEGRSADEHIEDENKRLLETNPHDQPMIPEERVNPALRELRERKMAAHHAEPDADQKRGDHAEPKHKEQDRKEGGDRGGKPARGDDDRVDEASEESFPASDPPAFK
jgi:hypothetical protein